MIFIINYKVKYIIGYENGFYRRTANISAETVVRQKARAQSHCTPTGRRDPLHAPLHCGLEG